MSKSLTAQDKSQIIELLQEGQPLPAKYRPLLFDDNETAVADSENEQGGFAAEERARLLESIVDHSPGIIYIYDIVTRCNVYSNNGIEKVLGYSVSEIQDMGENMIQILMHPDDFEYYKETILPRYAEARDGVSISNQYRMKDKTGEWRWLDSDEIILKRLPDGSPSQILGIIRDISDQKKMEEDLRDSESQYASLFENMLNGFALHRIIQDDDGKPVDYEFLAVNTAFERLTGLKRADIVGRNARSVIPGIEKDSVDWIAEYGRVALTGAEVRMEQFSAGLSRWYSVYAFRPKEGYFIVIFEDITDRKQAEDESVAYREFMDSVPGFGFAKDINLKYVSANRTFCDLLKIPYDEIGGKTDYDIFPSDLAEKYIEDDKRVIETGESLLVEEITFNANTNERFVVATRKHPWFDENGKIIGLYGMGFDITELKQAEEREKALQERLARSARMESLGVLAGGVAHDLNNVLGPIVALPEMISEDLADLAKLDIEDTQESLDAISAAGKRAATIVRDLVQLARRGKYKLSDIDLHQIQCLSPDCGCKIIKQLKAANPNVTFIHESEKEPLIVSGDESHLSRALSNLVQNAAESIEGKGTVTIRTFKRNLAGPLVGYATVPEGDYAVIEISDTGEGIAEASLGRIFEPFYTRKKKSERSGSGLGLSVVNGIIDDHGGFIDVKSEVGKGSIFSVYLPLIDRPREASAESESEPVVGGTERILIVDDEPGQRYIACKSLQRQGYDLTEVEDGHQALEYFSKAKKAGAESPCDLVVLDMIMEEGFDGLDTYEAILKLYPNQKALVASGHAEDGRAKAAEDLGATWLSKPYQVDDLARAVRKVLDRD